MSRYSIYRKYPYPFILVILSKITLKLLPSNHLLLAIFSRVHRINVRNVTLNTPKLLHLRLLFCKRRQFSDILTLWLIKIGLVINKLLSNVNITLCFHLLVSGSMAPDKDRFIITAKWISLLYYHNDFSILKKLHERYVFLIRSLST